MARENYRRRCRALAFAANGSIGVKLFVQMPGRDFLGTAGVDIGLQKDLGRHAVTPVATPLPRQARAQQMPFGFHRRKPLVPEDNRQAGRLSQPLTKLPRFFGFLAFLSTEMNRQADYDQSDLLVFNHLLEIGSIPFLSRSLISR